MTERCFPQEPVYDLLGVGFGPSHLATCAVFSSSRDRSRWIGKRIGFVERNRSFAWHPDMLLTGARMQVAFLKDLVTLKDPTSPYTFLNYLHEKGRLEDFVNLRTFYPTRREYHDYFAWAAEKLAGFVAYGRSVEGISPVVETDGSIRRLEICFRDVETGRAGSMLARNISLSLGGRPVIPSGVEPDALGDAAFHSSLFLTRIEAFHKRGCERPYRFLVVGAGQSAAETFHYLAREFPNAEVTLAFRSFALMPANSSPLANEIFNREMVDMFYDLPQQAKVRLMDALRQTNYAAVDDDLIQDIVETLYQQRIHGGNRLRLLRFRELVGCSAARGRVVADLKDTHTGEVTSADYDGVVFATGYDFRHAEELLAELRLHIRTTPTGMIAVRRDYAVLTDDVLQAGVFLHGATEHTHGLTSTLISLLPHRAASILDAALGGALEETEGEAQLDAGALAEQEVSTLIGGNHL